ncbi:hypothetical protein MBLNU13_g09716t1 [Cladosporium sp. NU13]
MDCGFDRYGDAFFSAPELLDPPPRDGPGRRRRRRQAMEDQAEAEQYRQLMDNQAEMDQYRLLQGPLAMSPPGVLEDPLSPFYAEELALSPPGVSREETMLGLACPAPSELDLMRSARSGAKDPTHMRFIDDMLGGFHQMPFDMGMGIMDRYFDLFGPTSGAGGDSLFADAYPSIERGPPDPMAAFYGEPREFLPRTPRRRRERSVTSGFQLPSGARGNPSMPRDRLLHDHLMGTPEANMLLGARPLPELRGTPLPPGFDDPPLPERRRNRRW